MIINKLKKILIIQTASIGDVILSTPLIEKLHHFFPEASIDFMLKKGNEGLFKAQGSRFISYAIPVKKEKEVKKHLDNLQNKHHDARHLCFAYQLGFDKSVYRISDGGEPSGTAGKQIFGQIRSKDLTNILIVVVRYFGGIKLGIHGLINAFRTASKNALDNATIITKTVNDVYEICYDYADMNNVMKILKEYETYLSVHIYSDKEHKRLNSIPTVFMQMIQRDAITI